MEIQPSCVHMAIIHHDIVDVVCYDSEGNDYKPGETYTEDGSTWWVLINNES